MSRPQFKTITRLRKDNEKLRKIIRKKNRRIFELEDQLLGRCKCQKRTTENQVRKEQEVERGGQVIQEEGRDIDHPHVRSLGIRTGKGRNGIQNNNSD
jgi:predicted RNase H-like nuclease (RuvC/YqgF family)